MADINPLSNFSTASAVTEANNNWQELNDEFEGVVYRDGSKTMTADLDMNGHNLLNIGDATVGENLVTLSQFQSELEDLAGTLATIAAYGSSQADVFTGNGTATQFTLTSNPGAENNLDVSIGGITQAPGVDYSWTGGTTITFVNPPPNGETVLIKYGVGIAVGDGIDLLEPLVQRAEVAALNAENVVSTALGVGSVGTCSTDTKGVRISPLFLGFKDGGTENLDPDNTIKGVVTVTDLGYDSNGDVVNKSRAIVVTKSDREDYPSQDTKVETEDLSGLYKDMWLSEPIYSSSTVGLNGSGYYPLAHFKEGVYTDNGTGGTGLPSSDRYVYIANRSTRAVPPPIANWAMSAKQRASGSFHVEAYVDHLHAFDNKPVPLVKFTVTDSAGTTAVGLSTFMLQSANTLVPVPTYQANIDVTGLAEGDATLSMTVYPWIGTPWNSSDNGNVYPTPQVCDIPVFVDNSGDYATLYGCLDTVAGNDGTGVISLVKATAEASPYLTLAALKTAAQSANNARGHNNMDAVEIRLTQNIAGFGSDISSWTVSKVPVVFSNRTSVASQTIGITDTATSVNRRIPDLIKFKGLLIESTTTGRNVLDGVDDGASAGLPVTYAIFDDCKLKGVAGSSAPTFLNIGMWDKFNCTIVEGGNSPYKHFGNNRGHWRLGMGNLNSIATASSSITGYCWTFLGNRFDYVQMEDAPTSATYVQETDGLIIAYNRFSRMTAAIDLATSRTYTYGLVFSMNVIEKTNAITNAFGLGSITTNTEIENAIVRNNTIEGERTNNYYAVDFDRSITECTQYNIFRQYNCKGDVFATAVRRGNMESRFGVNHTGNLSCELPDTDGFSTYGNYENPTSWLGDEFGINSAYNAEPNYTNNASLSGTGLGGGDYTPVDGTNVANAIPAGKAPYPFYNNGTDMPNDGTGYRGALM